MGLPPKDKFCLGFVLNEYLGFDFGLWKFEGGLYALYSCLLSEKTAHARTHRFTVVGGQALCEGLLSVIATLDQRLPCDM